MLFSISELMDAAKKIHNMVKMNTALTIDKAAEILGMDGQLLEAVRDYIF